MFPTPARDLFPHLQDAVIAYRLLFGIYSGIVPDGIDDLVVDDIDWAGDATILLSYVKGRTAAECVEPAAAGRPAARAVAGAFGAAARPRSTPTPAPVCGCDWSSPRDSGIGDGAVPAADTIQRWVACTAI